MMFRRSKAANGGKQQAVIIFEVADDGEEAQQAVETPIAEEVVPTMKPMPTPAVRITKPKPALTPLAFQPLKTRDPRVLVVADLLLNASEGEGGAAVPDDLRKWAADILGTKGASDVR